jgi:hypothetical protein
MESLPGGDVVHIVSFSGGMGSFAEAKSCCDKFGVDNTKLLFADTKIEDNDLYRFVMECVEFLQCDLEVIADGRTPFQVFKDVRYMGNSLVDPCSKVLKRDLLIGKITSDYRPEEVNVHLGIDFSEHHRLNACRERMLPYIYRSTLVEDGRIIPKDFSEKFGIKRPRLYNWGLGHNNCGGFCPKAGLGHYKALFEANPDRYKHFEREELLVYGCIGKKYPFLKKQENNVKKFITLREYRMEYLEKGCVSADEAMEFGGCGCAI